MQTANQIIMLQDFGKRERKSFIKQSLPRRIRFAVHYFKQGYSVKAAWLLAGGK